MRWLAPAKPGSILVASTRRIHPRHDHQLSFSEVLCKLLHLMVLLSSFFFPELMASGRGGYYRNM
jgi:hypothetical protein